MKPDIRQFTNNKLSLDEQLGLRFYNLEQTYRSEFIIKMFMMGLTKDNYIAFDSNTVEFVTNNPEHNMYLQTVQIIRYFGKEMVTRFITFNYEQEYNKLKEVS